MNIKDEYELTKQRGEELHPDMDFHVALYTSWKNLRAERAFWYRTCVVLACAIAALLYLTGG